MVCGECMVVRDMHECECDDVRALCAMSRCVALCFLYVVCAQCACEGVRVSLWLVVRAGIESRTHVAIVSGDGSVVNRIVI